MPYFGLLASVLLSQSSRFDRRAADWRNGSVVYQVFVDRFVPSPNLRAKKSLYAAPQKLREWSETPHATAYDEKIKTYPHVLEFWGGDLSSMLTKLDYVKGLGADVLYMTPIFKSISNHKYDTTDYYTVDPQLGTNADLQKVISQTHARGMKLMLDGVFNHIGSESPLFKEALHNPSSKHRNWFFFGPQYPGGYRGWSGIAGLPGWKIEDAGAGNYLWAKPDSVVQTYLRKGIDGWRLDVGFELGPKYVEELTRAAHAAKPGSMVVGEIPGYPSNWFSSIDGVFNFFAMNASFAMLDGKLSGGSLGVSLHQMAQDAGVENLLRSWLLVDNHDTERFADTVPDLTKRNLARVLQFTLPGSPVIYYGSELGMTGAGDPEDRAPMRWDLVNDQNQDLSWTRKLLSIRKSHSALRYGDFTVLNTNKLLAFTRTTDKLRETVIVAVNPTKEAVTEIFPSRVGRLQSWGELSDLLSATKVRSITGLINLTVPPQTAMILVPVTDKKDGYSPYNRID